MTIPCETNWDGPFTRKMAANTSIPGSGEKTLAMLGCGMYIPQLGYDIEVIPDITWARKLGPGNLDWNPVIHFRRE